jgi:mycothione reductase
MKKYDAIVIGAGSGLIISSKAAALGKKVAVVEESDMGGTCLNRGCIPSKIMIHHADIVRKINEAAKFGIKVKLLGVDYNKIVAETNKFVRTQSHKIEKGNKANKNIDLYKTRAEFVTKNIVKVGNEDIFGKKIFICAGTRATVPPIPGLNEVNYITSTEALKLKKLPKSLTVIGGGYIAAELAYFFHGMGSKITILERGEKLLSHSDVEVSKKFTEVASGMYNVLLKSDIKRVYKKNGEFVVEVKYKGKLKEVISDALLVATGRKPNTDLLRVENAGVKVNKYGYISVNGYMETSQKHIFAVGDIAGIYLFKHSANLEASYAINNAFGKRRKVDYTAMPHAVFTYPQIAGVGKREQDITGEYYVGKYDYMETGMGRALKDEHGFVKIIVDKKGKILGCHIIGTEASTLIHEVIIAMKTTGNVNAILDTVHIHPALNEVVQRAANNIN